MKNQRSARPQVCLDQLNVAPSSQLTPIILSFLCVCCATTWLNLNFNGLHFILCPFKTFMILLLSNHVVKWVNNKLRKLTQCFFSLIQFKFLQQTKGQAKVTFFGAIFSNVFLANTLREKLWKACTHVKQFPKKKFFS